MFDQDLYGRAYFQGRKDAREHEPRMDENAVRKHFEVRDEDNLAKAYWWYELGYADGQGER